MIFFSNKKKSYYDFDWIKYKNYYNSLKEYNTKDEYWWHYVHIGEKNGFIYFEIDNNNNLITSNSPRKTVYYFVDFVSKNTNRTGIQVVTIYLAKQLLIFQDEYYIDVIFIKWNDLYFCLEPCNEEDIQFLLNYNEKIDNVEKIKYNNYDPIHLNNFRPLKDCIFFCPELTFTIYPDLPKRLKIYLEFHKLKSIFILYDIIPLILGDYNCIREGFKTYLINNILKANKIITISNFTKKEFINYCQYNNLYNFEFPIIESIPLPFQYRNK